MRVRVVSDPDSLADLAAAAIGRVLRDADGDTDLGLAGGGTPRTTYLRMREDDLPWERVDVWMSDERWVPPDHPDSNARMARETLMDHVPARFHEVPWELGDPELAAAAYAATLDGIFAGRPPRVVVLGIGDDGHTASLFPGSPLLEEEDSSFAAVWVEDKDAWRLSATPPLLWRAEHLVFLVTGEAKAHVVADILGGESDLPAAVVARGARDVTWFLDRAAASRLEGPGHSPL